jgi:hypothetical protein
MLAVTDRCTDKTLRYQDPDVALAENVVRAGHAARWYSWRMPPRRSRLRMSSRIGDLRGQRVQRACVREALVWPVAVVELFELAQGVEQVLLVPDQGAVQQFASAGLHPMFHDRVHAGHPDAAEHDVDVCVLEHGVEQGWELSIAVPD